MPTVNQIETADGLHWFHVNQHKYRLLTESGIVESDEFTFPEDHNSEIVLSQRQITAMMGGRRFSSWEDANYWSEVMALLLLRKFDASEADSIPATCVPKTRLRQYRKSFLGWTKELKLGQAEMFASNPDLLRSLWNQAVSKMESYDYQEPLHAGGRNPLPDPAALDTINNTAMAAAFVQEHGIHVGDLHFNFVDREIAPLRTPGGIFEDGTPATATGRGGMDLLLQRDKRICAGEVKVGNDSPLFDALLQVLWYASEIASDNQMRRLRTAYELPGFDESKVDVAVISISQPDDDTKYATLSIVEAINQSENWNRLGKVYLIENRGDQWHLVEPT